MPHEVKVTINTSGSTHSITVDPEELRAAVRAAIAGGATQIGAVMGKVLPQFKGRAEGSTINAIAREELSRQG